MNKNCTPWLPKPRSADHLGKPQLTIVMITFNSAGVLENCLRSLKEALEYACVDYILRIVDNASSDGTLSIVRSYFPQADLIVHEQNLGYALSVNQALEKVESDWILLLNPDTVLPVDLLGVLAKVNDCPDIQAFSPLLVDENNKAVRTSYPWPSLTKETIRLLGLEPLATSILGRFQERLLGMRDGLSDCQELGKPIAVDYVVGAAFFISAKRWKEVGAFDEHFFLYHEEMEWCYRASLMGFSVMVLSDYSVLHMRAQSVSHPPLEVPLWRYAGLIYFYSKYRSATDQAVLKALVFLSFGIRAIFKSLTHQRQIAIVYMRIALLCCNYTASAWRHNL